MLQEGVTRRRISKRLDVPSDPGEIAVRRILLYHLQEDAYNHLDSPSIGNFVRGNLELSGRSPHLGILAVPKHERSIEVPAAHQASVSTFYNVGDDLIAHIALADRV